MTRRGHVVLWTGVLVAVICLAGLRGLLPSDGTAPRAQPASCDAEQAGGVSVEPSQGCVPCPAAEPGVRLAARAAAAAGFTGPDLTVAVAVAGAASGYDPAAADPSEPTRGMWQISQSAHRDKLVGDWADPYDNAVVARAVWQEAGGAWDPWEAYTSDAYKAHLREAEAVTACASPDSGGAAAPTPPRTAAGEPRRYPEKAVALYYMLWPNSGSPHLDSIPTDVNVLNLAFLQGDPPSLVGWGPQDEATFLAGVDALRARGVRIVASVGGAGGYVNLANRAGFVAGVLALNEKVPLDGLDWDVEGPSMSQADVVAISTELKARLGAQFAITMAPNGSNVDAYIPIAAALHSVDALDMIGQQFYDAVVSTEAALGRIDQMRSAGIPESKIGIGMMVGDTDAYWTVEECIASVSSITAKYPNLRGVYLWESGRAGTLDWIGRVGALLATDATPDAIGW